MTTGRLRFVGSRIVQIIPVLLLATLIVFGLLQLVPGDPAVTLAGEAASPERVAEIRQLYGMDRPLYLQYLQWLGNAATGDLSRSLLSGEPVSDMVFRRLPNTLVIVVVSLLISCLIGIPLGVFAATRPGSATDKFIMSISSIGIAVPNFWIGMILVSLLALGLNWFPATGAVPIWEDPLGALRHALLPSLALSATGIATISRQLRSALLDVLASQYIRTLRAKGLSPYAILWRHGLKNVCVPLLTVIGLLFNRLLGATVVIEAVFAIPGTGSLVVQAAIGKDFPVVQGVVMVMVVMVILVNLLIDTLYTVLDPRVSR